MPLKIYQQIAIIGCNCCLVAGLVLIVKGYGSQLGWWSVDATSFWTKVGDWSGAGITLLATCLVAASIYLDHYLHANWRPADWISYYISAPVAILGALGSLIWMIWIRKTIPDIVNGFAILGLVGAILRLLPFSEGKPFNM